ncbi:MAG: hypothetical protein KC440_06865, partial [Nitrosarchaeum sp.]|nr:hypothetical protein [Nitrosarchaeum sp.]
VMKMSVCKKRCNTFESASKSFVYLRGGCYCRICKHFFKEYVIWCPCCHMKTRYNAKNKSRYQNFIQRIT